MFADLELASRIETAEARLTRAAVNTRRREMPDSDAFAIDVGLGTAAFVRPGSPMNKVIGVFAALPSAEELTHIEGQYRQRSEPVRVELATLAQPDIGRTLTERGYRLLGFENVLGQTLVNRVPDAGGSISVAQVAPEQIEEWRQLVIDGFAQPDDTGVVVDTYSREVIEQVMSDFLGMDGLVRYLAKSRGVASGGASMRIDADIALMTGATTLAEHRRRGVQNALLQRRLSEAITLGAKTAIITTSGGTRSQANAMRQGFSLLYARAILVLDTSQ